MGGSLAYWLPRFAGRRNFSAPRPILRAPFACAYPIKMALWRLFSASLGRISVVGVWARVMFGRSVRGVERVNTLSKVGAAFKRSLFNISCGGMPSQSRSVAGIEVWSYGTPVEERNTVPASIKGDISSVGTRTPNRSKQKPCSPGYWLDLVS